MQENKENIQPSRAATKNIRPRPNAYILFSYEWWKAVAAAHREEANTINSQRLGAM
jgi:hypothetical protein